MSKKKAQITIPVYKLSINLNECIREMTKHFWSAQNEKHFVYTSWKEFVGEKK